jgi:hypothetical protein
MGQRDSLMSLADSAIAACYEESNSGRPDATVSTGSPCNDPLTQVLFSTRHGENASPELGKTMRGGQALFLRPIDALFNGASWTCQE